MNQQHRLKVWQSQSQVLLLLLIAIDLTLASIYLISSILFGKAISDFDFNIPRTIPVLFGAVKLFAIGFLLTLASCWRRHELPKKSWCLLLAVGTAFLYVSQDKIWKFHLLMHRFDWMPQFKSEGGEWVFYYLPIILLTIILGYRQLIALWRSYPRSTFFTVLGIGIFLIGGMGIEIINVQFLKPYITQIAANFNSTTAIVNSVKDTIEELTELLGESIALFGLTLFFSFRLAERDGEMGRWGDGDKGTRGLGNRKANRKGTLARSATLTKIENRKFPVSSPFNEVLTRKHLKLAKLKKGKLQIPPHLK